MRSSMQIQDVLTRGLLQRKESYGLVLTADLKSQSSCATWVNAIITRALIAWEQSELLRLSIRTLTNPPTLQLQLSKASIFSEPGTITITSNSGGHSIEQQLRGTRSIRTPYGRREHSLPHGAMNFLRKQLHSCLSPLWQTTSTERLILSLESEEVSGKFISSL
jgi:hypothetical protein